MKRRIDVYRGEFFNFDPYYGTSYWSKCEKVLIVKSLFVRWVYSPFNGK